MAKTANLTARIEPDIKDQAETIHLVFLLQMLSICFTNKLFCNKVFPLT